MGTFQLDCSFCDELIESEAVDAVKDRGVAHLEEQHDAALTSVFDEMYDDGDCRDCGSTFFVDSDIDGFACPDCGYDNFQPLVQRYVYWQIEAD